MTHTIQIDASKQRGARAKQPPRDYLQDAIEAHAELNMAGIPARANDGRKLTLVERLRLIPGFAIAGGENATG